MFVAQTPASALVFNNSSELCILVHIIYDLVINIKQTRTCFMVAVLQQLRRPEVHSNLNDDLKQMANDLDQMKLQRLVAEFIRQKEDHQHVTYMRERFAPDPEVVNGPKSWKEYWKKCFLIVIGQMVILCKRLHGT